MDNFETVFLTWIQAIAAVASVVVPIVIKKKDQDPDSNNSNQKIIIGEGSQNISIQQVHDSHNTYHQHQKNTYIANHYHQSPAQSRKSSSSSSSNDELWGFFFAVILAICTGVFIHRYLFILQIISFILTGIILFLFSRYPRAVLPFRKDKSTVFATLSLMVFFFQPVLVSLVANIPSVFIDYSFAQNLYSPDMNFGAIISITISSLTKEGVIDYGIYCLFITLSYIVLIATQLCTIFQFLFRNRVQGMVFKILNAGYQLRYGSLLLALAYGIPYSIMRLIA